MTVGALEIRGPADGLLDEALALTVRGAAGGGVTWRARLRDDDGRVWRAQAASAEALAAAWAPAKPTGAAGHPALASLRPLQLEVRVEAADGRAATRAVTRRLLAQGVERRRWRAPEVPAVLHLPPAGAVAATVVLAGPGGAAELAAPLLASRGALVLLTERGDEARACERLAAVPRAGDAPEVVTLSAPPPGIPGLAGDPAAWDALLARLGLAPRG